jgi:hypothetical protein
MTQDERLEYGIRHWETMTMEEQNEFKIVHRAEREADMARRAEDPAYAAQAKAADIAKAAAKAAAKRAARAKSVETKSAGLLQAAFDEDLSTIRTWEGLRWVGLSDRPRFDTMVPKHSAKSYVCIDIFKLARTSR